jgi:hypothetical protein
MARPEDKLPRHIDESQIIAHYSQRNAREKPRLPMVLDSITLATSSFGLGDAVVLSDLPRAGNQTNRFMSVFSPSEHFQTIMSFNPYYKPRLTPFCAIADVLYHSFDLKDCGAPTGFRSNLNPVAASNFQQERRCQE